MFSKRHRREVAAYGVCAMIGAAALGLGAWLHQDGTDATCRLLHPTDKSAQLDCRIAAVDIDQAG